MDANQDELKFSEWAGKDNEPTDDRSIIILGEQVMNSEKN